MTDAEQRLSEVLHGHQQRILVRWTGYEKILLFELARALDSAAFSQLFAFEQGSEDPRRTMLLGGATALLPLLERVKGTEGGVPWVLADEPLLRLADSHLHYCGRLANLLRLAALERYGLAKSTFVTPNHLRLEIVNGDIEYEDMHAVSHVHNRDEHDQPFQLFPQSAELLRRIDAYVDVEPSGLIRYDNDDDLIEYYSTLAARRAQWFLEGEALPPDAVIGGRSFARWLEAAVAASGRELQHIAFAIALASKRPELSLRNLVTLFVRRDDLHEVLLRFDEPPSYALELVRALTLDDVAAAACIADYEVPVPFYIDLGRDFVLLPCLGALLNPVATLVRFLRSQYRLDWDRAVERREDLFRADIRRVFPVPRFHVPESGIQLRRQDRSVITDIDAVVLDNATGSLALVQLKWHDIYGRSLKERDSRRRNLLDANKWVTRVRQWIDGRSA
ncbi:MAG TPA: hypothetical protein VFO89_06720, partial [Thermoanaerobaculia bacterium]|nr:hypothetical protein [Thermoanaerobaculia bacterium]